MRSTWHTRGSCTLRGNEKHSHAKVKAEERPTLVEHTRPPSPRAECSDSLQFAQTCMRTRGWRTGSRRGKGGRLHVGGRGLSKWDEQVSLCLFADLAENVEARATLAVTFPRFLPTNSALLFDQCLPPGLDFTRRVHLDGALQLVRRAIAKTHIVKNVQTNARRHFIFDKRSTVYIAGAASTSNTLYTAVFFKLLLIT